MESVRLPRPFGRSLCRYDLPSKISLKTSSPPSTLPYPALVPVLGCVFAGRKTGFHFSWQTRCRGLALRSAGWIGSGGLVLLELRPKVQGGPSCDVSPCKRIVRKSGCRFFAINDALVLRVDQPMCVSITLSKRTLILYAARHKSGTKQVRKDLWR